jgi:predicted alpha/beta superfamily hydrolase
MIRGWKKIASVAALALAVQSLAAGAHAQQAPVAAQPAGPGYMMGATQTWDITSDKGQVYRIFISYPTSGEPPQGGYPVLYVLDGNAIFGGFAETRRLFGMIDAVETGKSIVVGVGYPTDQPYDIRRVYDFTGGPPPAPWDVQLKDARGGGWDEFLDFLTGKLRTEVGKRYKTNPDRQALFGHSLGGLFALHTLFTRPDAFHAIVAASPSLFWDKSMPKQERDFVARLEAGKIPKVARLMVVAGELEETPLERWDGEAFAKRMEALSAYGLRTRSQIYVGEGHMTVPIRATADTLRFAFTWP